MGDERLDRRQFLRLAAAGAVCAAAGAGCSSDAQSKAGPRPEGAGGGRPSLRIAQWSHFIPQYDTWFDTEYAKRWGEAHDVDVVVDHIPYAELPARAGAEVAAGHGHDLFAFITAPAALEDEVIDHREVIDEVEARIGPMAPIVRRHVFNPKTGKYFGLGQYWVPNPVHYRTDLWERVRPGGVPSSWDDVLRAAPDLKAAGRPVGIGLSDDDDSNFSLLSLMAVFGARLQDEENRLALDAPATVEAVKMGAAIYRAGMTDDVFRWDSSSNNRLIATGHGSLILNTISAIRAAEDQDRALAGTIGLAPALSGPAARLGVNSVVGVYVIWRFSEQQDRAKQFLIDLAVAARDALLQSRFYNLPAFPGAVPDLKALVGRDEAAQPPTKYAILADAESWSTNIGHPGHDNAATDEVFSAFIIPKMFAAAARGELSAEEAVKRAHAEAEPIFAKWRERGRI